MMAAAREGQSRIVASMARPQGRVTFPHLGPFAFPRVTVHDNQFC